MNSKYRIVSAEGVFEYLQYEKTSVTSILGIKFQKITWEYIPYAENFLDNVFDFRKYICEHNTKLMDFVKKYPDINTYFEYTKNYHAEIDEIVKRKKQAEEIKRTTIKYL